jgi:hypothetical protein
MIVHGRPRVLLMFVLALVSMTVLAPAAIAKTKAKPKPGPKQVTLLPDRSCYHLLTKDAFPDSTGEGPAGGRDSAQDDYTTCLFEGQEPTEEEPHPKGGGGDTLHVFHAAAYKALEHGSKHTLLILFPPPPGSDVQTPLRGIGTRGYWVLTNDGGTYGVVQVRNDVFTFLKEGSGNTPALLSIVADELCDRCK